MARLYGRRWSKKRARQLKLEPLCRLCFEAGRLTSATVADHIEPHRDDPVKFWTGALQSLCETCHNAVKQAMEKSGHLRGGRADGMPIDPRHHWNSTEEGRGAKISTQNTTGTAAPVFSSYFPPNEA